MRTVGDPDQSFTIQVGFGTATFGVGLDPAFVRITAGTAVVDDPAVWGAREGDPSWAAWALAMADRTLPSGLVRGGLGRGSDFARSARAIGARWTDRDLSDETMQSSLARLSAWWNGKPDLPTKPKPALTATPAE